MTTDQKKSAASAKRTPKLSGPDQVEAFLNKLEHPLKPEIEAVRNIILRANSQLREHIKWNAPSFHDQAEDRITFHLRGKDFFLLVFHCGAKAKERADKGPLFEDTTGLLQWVAADRATVRLTSMEDVITKKDKLVEVINKWLEVNGSQSSG